LSLQGFTPGSKHDSSPVVQSSPPMPDKSHYKRPDIQLEHQPIQKRINIEQFQEFPYPKLCKFERPPPGIGTEYKIAVFYHVGMVNNWKDIVRDQLHTMDICGLGHMASSFSVTYSNISKTDEIVEIMDEFSFTKSLKLSYIQATAAPWEREAISAMSRTCQNVVSSANAATQQDGSRTVVYYFHNKGASRYTNDWRKTYKQTWTYSRVLYWRKYMEWFLLERPTLCLRAILNHGASTCGVSLHHFPSWHYSGNFWVASCDWILSLPPTVVFRQDNWDFIAAELWAGQNIPLKKNYADESLNVTKYVELFESTDFNEMQADLYEYLILPEIYAQIDDAKTKGRESSIWLDYLSGLKGE